MRIRTPRCRSAVSLAVAGALAVTLVPMTAPPAAAQEYCRQIDAHPRYYDTSPAREPGRFGYGVLFHIVATMCLLNKERQRLGLREVEESAELRAAARAHLLASLEQKWWGRSDPHADPRVSGTGSQQIIKRIQAAGYCAGGRSWKGYEILYAGWGSGGTPRSAVHWWLNVSTQGHDRVIRDPEHTHFGVQARGGSAYRADDGKSGAATYVVTFGSCQR
ncbi:MULTISPECIES: CAP domain-containing protein [unclassified Streptomyces]|uniref:CAP domain-containing protein n=1 Tax=unclassified Streptomyces TaxID=2593676 RepID=UPI00332BDE7A